MKSYGFVFFSHWSFSMSSTSIGRPQRLTPGLMASGLGLDDRQLMVPKSQGQPTVWMVLKPSKTLVNHGRNYLFLHWCSPDFWTINSIFSTILLKQKKWTNSLTYVSMLRKCSPDAGLVVAGSLSQSLAQLASQKSFIHVGELPNPYPDAQCWRNI